MLQPDWAGTMCAIKQHPAPDDDDSGALEARKQQMLTKQCRTKSPPLFTPRIECPDPTRGWLVGDIRIKRGGHTRVIRSQSFLFIERDKLTTMRMR